MLAKPTRPTPPEKAPEVKEVEAEEPAKPVLLKKPAGPGQQKPEAESVVAQEEPAPAPAEPAPQLMARPAMKAPEPEPEPEEATLPTVESTVTKSRDNMYSGTQVTFCIGNEAGDLDSIVSALGMAYWSARKNKDAIVVPIAQFSRAEFQLRKDAVLAFQEAGFEMDDQDAPKCLTFWDEVEWDKVADSKVILVDHNKMSPEVEQRFAGRVSLIVDHHINEGAHSEAKRLIEEGIGSTCTLVSEILGNDIPQDLGVLLMSTVLLDTRYFDTDKRFKETDQRDFMAVEKLQALRFTPAAAMTRKNPQRAWYGRLMKARATKESLSPEAALRVDFKGISVQFHGRTKQIGFSSLSIDLAKLLENEQEFASFRAAVYKVVEAKSLDLLIGVLWTDSRDMDKGLIMGSNQVEGDEMVEHIEDCLQKYTETLSSSLMQTTMFQDQRIAEEGFGLKPLAAPFNKMPLFHGWYMRGLVTRKTLLPAIAECFEKAP
jgi:exopolyphosphatase